MGQRSPRPQLHECLILDLGCLLAAIRIYREIRGTVAWTDSNSLTFRKHPEHRRSLFLEFARRNPLPTCRADRQWPIGQHVEYIERDQPFGSSRFFGLCPKCDKRAKLLYLPPNGLHFGCRTCHRVDYSVESRYRADRREFRELCVNCGYTGRKLNKLVNSEYPEHVRRIAPVCGRSRNGKVEGLSF